MNRDIKKLAREFNRVAPAPPAPRDGTVYENKRKDDSSGPPVDNAALPTWIDTLPSDREWYVDLFKSDLYRAINDNTQALKNLPQPPTEAMIKTLEKAQVEALRQSRRQGDYFGYRIFDPFHPLENIESDDTKAWIEAENERTQKFTSTSARDMAVADLTTAWRNRIPEPFSTGADRSLCLRFKYDDSWQYPVEKKERQKFYHTNETPLAEAGGRIFARAYRNFRSSIVSYPIDDPATTTRLVSEPPDGKMRGAFIHGDRLYVSFYRNCADELKVYDLDGKHIADVPLPVCKLRATSIDKETGKLRLRLATFTRPESDFIYDPETNSVTPDDPAPAPLEGCIVEQIWARSRDGTTVPMWTVRQPSTALDGTAATKIFAYGASGISVEPQYSESIARWVRSGGIYVIANIRGGGEFGEEWANNGMKMNRQNVIDDLTACARELWRRHYSVPERTVITGRSNGGWLILETVVQNSVRFGAAVSHVPVSDLNRIGTGSGTFPEYWTEKGFAERMRLSPYHNVKPGMVYTPTMITTGDEDTVAKTWHALKMAATLQAASPENLCLLRVRHGTGHKPELFPTDELVAEEADVHAFIERCIGPVDQQKYNAWLESSVENEVDHNGAKIAEKQYRGPS
ncbi:MAG TPA: prolyl oligopeptidase family serine peptidase [Patescibacteria group bacterium]|nr:prolyl oligopeptidase family serine peptidase [Patescibacteria group bacterium]